MSNNELVIFKSLQPLQIFTENKADDFLSGVEKEVEEFKKTRDISTQKGRDEIKSFAFKIAKTKSPLDKAGLSLTEDMRNKIKLINEERARIKEKLEFLQEDVRKPLTDFENAEKERIKIREDRIKLIQFSISNIDMIDNLSSDLVKKKIKELSELEIFDWQEFKTKAENEYREASDYLNQIYQNCLKREKEQEELEKTRKEKEERERREREEQIAKEATERAERKAKEEAERKEKLAEEEKYRLEAEKKALELAKIEAEKRAEQEKIEAQERIKQAEIRAKKEQEEAIAKERARVEKERLEKEAEEKAKAENLAHKTKVYKQMISDLSKFDTTNEDGCKDLIKAIAEGRINNIFIKY